MVQVTGKTGANVAYFASHPGLDVSGSRKPPCGRTFPSGDLEVDWSWSSRSAHSSASLMVICVIYFLTIMIRCWKKKKQQQPKHLHWSWLQKAAFFVQIQSSSTAGNPFDLAWIWICVAPRITLLASETSAMKRLSHKCWAEDYLCELSFLPPEAVLLEWRVGRCTGVKATKKGFQWKSNEALWGHLFFHPQKWEQFVGLSWSHVAVQWRAEFCFAGSSLTGLISVLFLVIALIKLAQCVCLWMWNPWLFWFHCDSNGPTF